MVGVPAGDALRDVAQEVWGGYPGLLLLPEADSLKASRSSIFLDDKPQPRGASGSLMMGSEETVNPLNVRVPESQVSGRAPGSLFVWAGGSFLDLAGPEVGTGTTARARPG